MMCTLKAVLTPQYCSEAISVNAHAHYATLV